MKAKLSKWKGFLVIFEGPVFFQSLKHLGCCRPSFRVSFCFSLKGAFLDWVQVEDCPVSGRQ